MSILLKETRYIEFESMTDMVDYTTEKIVPKSATVYATERNWEKVARVESITENASLPVIIKVYEK